MRKAILLSVNPKWCELIASGEKTMEVRRTRPKIDEPFKCYIYMTRGFASYKHKINGVTYICNDNGGRHVIGEFTCNYIEEWVIPNHEYSPNMPRHIMDRSCLSYQELRDYSKGSSLFFWDVSSVLIYEKSAEIDSLRYCDARHGIPVKRPPLSWGYVEEV